MREDVLFCCWCIFLFEVVEKWQSVKPYFLQGPLSNVFAIENLRQTTSRIWNCAEPKFRLNKVEQNYEVVINTTSRCQVMLLYLFIWKKNILPTAYPRCKNKTESYFKDLKRVLTLPFTNAFIYHKPFIILLKFRILRWKKLDFRFS